MNRTLRRAGIAVTILLLAVIGQLTYLQVVAADRLADDPRNVRRLTRDFSRPRGDIVTSDGVIVAHSVPSHDELVYRRVYPEGPLYAQVGGYQSFVFGNTGVEATYNDPLVGRDARLQLRNVRDLLTGRPQTGTVVLSLSDQVQRVARDALAGQRGSVVALDVASGGVVALYSNPTFDPNVMTSHDFAAVQGAFDLLRADPANPALARAYRETYPPGSTFKTVTASVALRTGTATPETEFPVLTSLPLPQSTTSISNFGREACGGTLFVSFTRSCNTTFARLGLELGDRFVPGMSRFGIGLAPPLDVRPGAVESTGPAPGSFRQNQPAFAMAGIGQGPDLRVTPLEMALVAAGIANQGAIMRPHVVAEIRDYQRRVVSRTRPSRWLTATDPATAAEVTKMMISVVSDPRGTGTAARIPGVSVAGKTGTAETGPDANPHAWFIAFAPAEAPRFAVAVLVEHGGNRGSEATGGRVAAPIARAVLQAALALPAGS